MKKIILCFAVLLLTFCSACSGTKSTVKQEDIKGYWQQTERDWSGEVDDLTGNPYAYLEITDDRLFFYTEADDLPGYYDTIARKYYKLEDGKIYYDYYELKGNNWKENIDELYGGIFEVTFENGKLILTEYYGENKDDGYEKNTYKKIGDEDRLLDPQTLIK